MLSLKQFRTRPSLSVTGQAKPAPATEAPGPLEDGASTMQGDSPPSTVENRMAPAGGESPTETDPQDGAGDQEDPNILETLHEVLSKTESS